ncbi:hypothetical protein [Variovorax paradoxus]|uniref:Uncharacterized protein n=1 Tax=Variovorax paradoxus TaxID=34073 RepID=A0A6I6HIG8_VARPD|nr:hypothetical protein [Variovorax paradoxus]QGW80727.1 hypothetical protein GOQ09_03605 [Variovorax paradoxus]
MASDRGLPLLAEAPSMDSTQKTARPGVDIRVALSSSTKTTALKGRQGLSSAKPQLDLSSVAIPLRSKVKAVIRRIARVCYRAVKPFARPIAFRLRAYFTIVLQHEIQQAHLRTIKELEQHARLQRQSTERLLATHTATLLKALKSSQKATSPELEALRAQSEEQLAGVQQLLQKILVPGDTFVNVGAGVGANALAAHLALEGQGRVVAFAPSSAVHAPLRGPLRIDDILGDNDRADLIVIDSGNAGLHVLEGASRSIAFNRNIAVVVELGTRQAGGIGDSSRKLLPFFNDRGFQYAVIDSASGALHESADLVMGQTKAAGLLFARPGSPAWARARGEQ